MARSPDGHGPFDRERTQIAWVLTALIAFLVIADVVSPTFQLDDLVLGNLIGAVLLLLGLGALLRLKNE